MSSLVSVIEIPECSLKCRSVIHGTKIISALTRNQEIELLAYIRQVCTNYARVTDGLGRNALHMAASCGRKRVVKWLMKHDRCEPDIKDWESGWTALHRSFYYGQLTAAKILIEHGASLQVMDSGCCTPLDIVIHDRLPYVEYSLAGPCEVYVWGCNTNFNLGLEKQQSRSSPEILEIFKRERLSIKQVVMCKYHTVFLSHDGRVFSCGHGQGGRLGHDCEQTFLAPNQIKTLCGEECTQVAGGTDHTVFLTKSGSVWTCGFNSYHQLGHLPPPERLLTPKIIKSLKGCIITGIAASRFHTVVYNKEAVYTMGLNAGQLGHLKGEKYETNPRKVSAINTRESKIVELATSDGATVFYTDGGDVYVLYKYQCRKIAFKQLDILSLAAVGGHLDAKCKPDALKDNGGLELKIVMLTKAGKLYIWKESLPHFVRCIFSTSNQLFISTFSLNRTSIVLITNDGEGYLGSWKTLQKSSDFIGCGDRSFVASKKEKRIGKEELDAGTGDHKGKDVAVKSSHSYSSKSFVEFLEKENCETLVVKRLPGIHRAVASACDPKGKNFAILQSHPATGILEFPDVDSSNLNEHLSNFLDDSNLYDIYDVVLQAGEEQFSAHRYILASRSEYFSRLFLEQFAKKFNSADHPIVVENIHPEIFRQLLKYIYSNTCDYFTVGYRVPSALLVIPGQLDGRKSAYEVGKNQKKSAKESVVDKCVVLPVIKRVQDAARKMGLNALVKQMDFVKIRDNVVVDVPSSDKINKPMKFDRRKHPHLSDANIICEDGTKLQCHKSILVARLEYFQSMFASGWIETNTSGSLHLPLPANVLEVVVDYLYTDESPILSKCDDADFLCRILVVSDQLLIERLKQMCEKVLADLITLKNATEFLEFSYMYKAKQMQQTCMEFIGVNLAAILDNRGLSILSDDVLDLLSKNYRNMIPAMQYRLITPYSDAPSEEEILVTAQQHPVLMEEKIEDDDGRQLDCAQQSMKKQKVKRKQRPNRNVGGQTPQKEMLVELDVEDCTELPPEPESPPKMISATEPISIPIASSQQCCVSFSYESSISPDLTPNPSSVDSVSTPWSKKQFFSENLDLKSIMQQQKEYEIRKHNTKVKSGTAADFKKTSKLSQKQKKKLSGSFSGLEIECPLLSCSDESKVEVVNPWGRSAIAATECFSEIMKSEATVVNENPRRTSIVEDKIMEPISSPHANPWSKSAREELSFVDIMQDEQTKSANLKKVQNQPLHLIQIEEQAIEELLKYYNAVDNPEEVISIQRILPQSVAVPVWKVSTKDYVGTVKKHVYK